MDKLLEALYFSSAMHSGQYRKDKTTPFISHPLSVALIASRYTSDMNIIIAAVLHDIVEDCDVSLDDIEQKFGSDVAIIVKQCTEENKDAPWVERKQKALDKVKDMDDRAALVKLSDILHNLFETSKKVKENTSSFYSNFNASLEMKAKYDMARFSEFKKYHSNLEILKEIEPYVMSQLQLAVV